MKERYEKRLFRLFAEAGYSPVRILTITPEEMVEIPGITVPNIRTVLNIQNKVLSDKHNIRVGTRLRQLLDTAQENDEKAKEA